MTTETNNKSQIQNLNIAADEFSIYQDGQLSIVTVEELLENPVALRQLINDFNLSKRENDRSKTIIDQLKLERAGYALQPAIMSLIAIMNILGVVLVGIGTNYITSDKPPSGAWIILIIGALISLLTAITPIALPYLINYYSKRKSDAN